MRFSVPISCVMGNIDFCEGVRTVASIGYDAVEAYNWKTLGDLDKIREVCDENGVEFLSICTTEFRLTDPAFRADWLNGLKESCVAAKTLGAHRMITQVGQDNGTPRADQHDAIVATLREAAPILAENDIIMMIEPLNTYVNHPGYFLTSSHEAFDIIRAVDSPFVKIVFDIYHQQVMEGNILPNILGNLDAIAHLHAAGHPGRHELQNGENDYHFIFSEIDKAGYQGACGLEYRPLMEPVESLREAMRLYGTKNQS